MRERGERNRLVFCPSDQDFMLTVFLRPRFFLPLNSLLAVLPSFLFFYRIYFLLIFSLCICSCIFFSLYICFSFILHHLQRIVSFIFIFTCLMSLIISPCPHDFLFYLFLFYFEFILDLFPSIHVSYLH